ncbi:NUMOD3 domain-containing DNA-binding protein (plasmid) [Bradyrhizobium elkanii]|uniref:NUMOD3 domain-containing DNA-binding protein n=1 Tax=Bradyrhizobium elkanii TaxID=29448 RepID=UPI002714725C|nr:NUMOD3 domain-containing DNA-binding protein [Bradyrhizobium elkanii]WLB14814.1 NUMOD3 domain-containing DNA-binding protein [Bradyrhizobium elkanii]WLB69095.1 NUMOD3 domain-containing DNA-binding protein [Bradyrhizobium elkanii]
MISIYILRCPITGEIRYVGKTSHDLIWRLKAHISEASRRTKDYRCKWIRSLIDQGLNPIIELDCVVPAGQSWQEVERARIAHYRSIGCRLANGTAGGEGLYMPSDEVRARMSESARNKKLSDDVKIKMAEIAAQIGRLNRGKVRSEETRRRCSEAFRGRRHSEETKRKMSEARKGKPHSEEWKRNISVAHQNLSPEAKEKIDEARKRRWSPEAKAACKTPEYRAKMVEVAKRRNTPEYRAIMSAAAKRRTTPEYIAMLNERRRLARMQRQEQQD